MQLRFTYAGDVLSDAGNGLLYVGERGTWYPNLGLSPAQFDMEFHYPANWTLLATGKQMAPAVVERSGKECGVRGSGRAAAEKISRWISERPIPVAGFNLGKYVRAEAKSGNILVEAYGTKGVEKSFPKAPAEEVGARSGHFPGRIETIGSDRPSLRRRRRQPAMLRPWPTAQPRQSRASPSGLDPIPTVRSRSPRCRAT